MPTKPLGDIMDTLAPLSNAKKLVKESVEEARQLRDVTGHRRTYRQPVPTPPTDMLTDVSTDISTDGTDKYQLKTPEQRQLWEALQAFDGQFTTNRKIWEYARISDRTLQRHIQPLIKSGAISRQTHNGLGVTYYITGKVDLTSTLDPRKKPAPRSQQPYRQHLSTGARAEQQTIKKEFLSLFESWDDAFIQNAWPAVYQAGINQKLLLKALEAFVEQVGDELGPPEHQVQRTRKTLANANAILEVKGHFEHNGQKWDNPQKYIFTAISRWNWMKLPNDVPNPFEKIAEEMEDQLKQEERATKEASVTRARFGRTDGGMSFEEARAATSEFNDAFRAWEKSLSPKHKSSILRTRRILPDAPNDTILNALFLEWRQTQAKQLVD